MSKKIAGSVGIIVSVGLVSACWPLNPLEDCELNPNLACFWGDAGVGDGGIPPQCIPGEDNKTIADGCGVFVSNSGDDARGEGSQAKPLKTLAAAVEKAASTGKPVYACAEEFVGSVTLASGLTLYGGLDCDDGWKYIGTTTRSVLVGDANDFALTLAKNAGGAEVVDFTIRAVDATEQGGSSIAVLADQVTAALVRCELIAGNGAVGAAGAPGDPDGMPAMAGAAGNNGVNACSDVDGTPGPDPTLPGGNQVTNDCGGDISVGGKGGHGNVPNGGGGNDGQMGTAGVGGKGETVVGMWSCLDGTGQIGSSGEAGTPGAGAAELGSISASGYIGTSGGAGTSGKAGQGGGGGGGAKGGMICAPANMTGSGASGGSGGAGGCGGLPGQGGGPGGASIALVSVNASVTLTDCNLSSSKGGVGGAGGDLQPGGFGGTAGVGGQGTGGSKSACDGGKGGAGGNGGPGGGGLGGPSLGIAVTGNPPIKQGTTTVAAGTSGEGGPGGNANTMMNAGAAGIAAEEQEFP